MRGVGKPKLTVSYCSAIGFLFETLPMLKIGILSCLSQLFHFVQIRVEVDCILYIRKVSKSMLLDYVNGPASRIILNHALIVLSLKIEYRSS